MKKYMVFVSGLMVLFALTSNLPAAGKIKVTFVNKSGYPDNQVFLYVTGDDGDIHGYYDFNTQSYVVPRAAPLPR